MIYAILKFFKTPGAFIFVFFPINFYLNISQIIPIMYKIRINQLIIVQYNLNHQRVKQFNETLV